MIVVFVFNGGFFWLGGFREFFRIGRSMVEYLGLGFGEIVSVEMLLEDGSCGFYVRVRFVVRRSSSSVCWVFICCLVVFFILAGFIIYLFVG